MTNRVTAPHETHRMIDLVQTEPRPPSGPTVPDVDAGAVASARARLLTHRLDPERAGCAACGRPSPCPTANEAAAVVVAGGAWNTLPFEPSPPGWQPRQTGGGRPRRLGRARAALARWAR